LKGEAAAGGGHEHYRNSLLTVTVNFPKKKPVTAKTRASPKFTTKRKDED
jgi:hypothetical protein